ncbi:MAG TPA: glutathione S-transferase [Burkholderiaceae bacterium]|nr:glutathione S-transferase [Burkholderiaceae bacterium]HQR71888.1 glutathione S-transferase [Burkholderiaceae bacterium]
MITVHHLNNSRSQRVLWLLEELGVEYEIKKYERDPKTMLAPPELRAVHPLGKSPVITDGDLTIAESGAILEYLVERYDHGALAPAPGTPERLRWSYWLHFAEGSAMPPLLVKLIFDRIVHSPMPFFVRPIVRTIASKVVGTVVTPNLERQWDFMESELTRSAWFAGDTFSAADIQMSFPIEAAAQRAGLDARRPKLMGWLKRIHARPAYKRALKRGGPYSFVDE